MNITMTETRRGTEDGFTVKRFLKGQTYDIAHSLGVYFVQQGWAVQNDKIDEEQAFQELLAKLRADRAARNAA